MKRNLVQCKNYDFPIIGQGAWNIGEVKENETNEINAIRFGIELGMNLIDTAEMYGEGKSELLIGNAIKNVEREKFFLVSKVLPIHCNKNDIFLCCDESLKRLQTDYIDLYLLHWRGSVFLEEMVECMEKIKETKKILNWGVSNFDVSDMEELWKVSGGNSCAANQIMYNLISRGVEFDLLPWLSSHNVLAMAYSPLAQAGKLKRMNKSILNNKVIFKISQKYQISVMQVLLAFIIRRRNIVAIPKSTNIKHVIENVEVVNVMISNEDLYEIDKEFLPPSEKMHLDMN
jgi:diketogulonate reductase-like aldo/keto reductase